MYLVFIEMIGPTIKKSFFTVNFSDHIYFYFRYNNIKKTVNVHETPTMEDTMINVTPSFISASKDPFVRPPRTSLSRHLGVRLLSQPMSLLWDVTSRHSQDTCVSRKVIMMNDIHENDSSFGGDNHHQKGFTLVKISIQDYTYDAVNANEKDIYLDLAKEQLVSLPQKQLPSVRRSQRKPIPSCLKKKTITKGNIKNPWKRKHRKKMVTFDIEHNHPMETKNIDDTEEKIIDGTEMMEDELLDKGDHHQRDSKEVVTPDRDSSSSEDKNQ